MKRYQLEDLLYLMKRLRTPETGCPWDLEQNYLSITPSTIEEAYEVVDAIERQDFDHLKEELGDLLFQVVFYGQLASEDGYFQFGDVVHELSDKLIRRHPHVFPDGTLQSVKGMPSISSSDKVKEVWEQIKAEERDKKGNSGILDDVPVALPALQRSQKLQKRVAKAGMDFRDLGSVFEALREEIAELEDAVETGSQQDVEEELGDVLFSCVNLSRHLDNDADQSLRAANNKFEQRIKGMETLLNETSLSWKDCDDETLDRLWQQAKSKLRCSD